jgi:hypothetical protein
MQIGVPDPVAARSGHPARSLLSHAFTRVTSTSTDINLRDAEVRLTDTSACRSIPAVGRRTGQSVMGWEKVTALPPHQELHRPADASRRVAARSG